MYLYILEKMTTLRACSGPQKVNQLTILLDKLASKQIVLDQIIYLLNILAYKKNQIKIPQCNINHMLTNLSNRGRTSDRNSAFLSASCTLPIGRHFGFYPSETNVLFRDAPS